MDDAHSGNLGGTAAPRAPSEIAERDERLRRWFFVRWQRQDPEGYRAWRSTPEYKEMIRKGRRRRYAKADTREKQLLQNKEWLRKKGELDPAWKATRLAKSMAYYWRNRERIAEQRREKYWRERAQGARAEAVPPNPLNARQ